MLSKNTFSKNTFSNSKKRVKHASKNTSKNISKPYWLNPSLNLSGYKNIFKHTEIITIPNFLHTTIANNLYSFITEEMDEAWWYLSSYSGGEKIILENIDANQDAIIESKNMANQKFINNEFSYIFYRTYNNHFPDCTCMECQFRKIAKSDEFVNIINQITGLNLVKNNELFISRYSADCFLSTHNDKGNGTIAMVINLTKNWRPQFGGNLHILTKDRSNIREVILPNFNSLTIFKIPEKDGIPHYVSHVISSVPFNRYAISGWFS